MKVPTLDVTPRPNTGRGVASNAETPHAPAYTATGQALHRAAQPDYFGWLEHVRAAAGCTRPIRLAGDLLTVDGATGVVLDNRHTDNLPDRAIYKACGNRRSRVCPACAQVYQRDAYQLLRAGLVGGKGIPDTVSKHPAVFATFTAPSFGTVHTRHVRKHTCPDRRRCDCRPAPCHPRRSDDPNAGLCPHGTPAVCWARHEPGDPLIGQPLCLDCYDHDHQVVWNLYSGELWRRIKQAIERHLAQLARQRNIPPVEVLTATGKVRRLAPVRVSHGKAAEFQIRGAVHFHALLRLDGVNPDDLAAIVPPPTGITPVDLEDAITAAVAQVAFHTPPHPDQPGGWPIAWGEQVDVRHISLGAHGEVTDGMVAGYLAKYATKSTEATGHSSTRLDADSIDTYANPEGDHTQRLINACWQLGRPLNPPEPLSERPDRRPATGERRPFDTPWTCPDCHTSTRYAACPVCVARCQAELDTQSAKPTNPNPYARLRRWAHMLGFGGHFLTKARRYSVTFTLLRDTRIAFRRNEEHHQEQPAGIVRAVEHLDEETTLIVGVLTFAGTGWHTTGDALLANTAAALARARQTAGREELAHELGTPLTTSALVAA